MSRGRSTSPRPLDGDVDMGNDNNEVENPNAKVVIVTNLTRNVFEAHLQTIFGFYGEIVKVDLPLYATSGQNRGKAALEYVDAASAHKAASHMNGGYLDGATVHVEVSDLPIQSTRPRSRQRGGPPRNGRHRSHSLSVSPRPRRRGAGGGGGGGGGYDARDSYRDRAGPRPYGGRRGPPQRVTSRRYSPTSRSRTRSRSPVRRGGRLPPRRRSPSYARGGTGYRGRSRSPSYSVTSSRSRGRSYSRSRSGSRSRSRSRSYSSYSGRSRSKSRSRSASRSRGRRSISRDDIRDSRSRSRSPHDDM